MLAAYQQKRLLLLLSDESGELLQRLFHDDSTINTVMSINIIIIISYYRYYRVGNVATAAVHPCFIVQSPLSFTVNTARLDDRAERSVGPSGRPTRPQGAFR